MAEEKKALIGSIQKFSTEDGPGIRSTVFIKGCPLDCKWCHNPEMIKPEQQMIISPSKCIGCMACVGACPNGGVAVSGDGPMIDRLQCTACGECAAACYADAIRPVAVPMNVSQVIEVVKQDKDFYDNTGGGVTLSGGEVLMHGDFAGAVIDACATEGIRVCLDTSGFGDTGLLVELASKENVEHVLFDMKHMDPQHHLKYTGVDNGLIIENLRALAADEKTAGKLWMRMPLIAGVNDDREAIEAAGQLYCELGLKRVTLIAYHDLGKSKSLHIGAEAHSFEAPTDARLDEIRDYFASMGMEADINGRE